MGTCKIAAVFADIEARLSEMVIGEVETHAGSAGDFEDLVEVALGSAREQS